MIKLCKSRVAFHIETTHLIYSANQVTGETQNWTEMGSVKMLLVTQVTYTFSKSTVETPELCVKST